MQMEWSHSSQEPARSRSRIGSVSTDLRSRSDYVQRLEDLVALAAVGLSLMYEPANSAFPHTMRGTRSPDGPRLTPQGDSIAGAAIVALGLSRAPVATQRRVLAGFTALDLAHSVKRRALHEQEFGVTALTVWALAEVAEACDTRLLQRLDGMARSAAPMPTVVCAWALNAALAASHVSDTVGLADRLAARLQEAQGPSGLFPHLGPAATLHRSRTQIGSFADQAHTIRALAGYSMCRADTGALAVADRCATKLCQLQGLDGEWWWRYDARSGSVVDRFPVYSVHQYALAPMALLDLEKAGGRDHQHEVARGVQWIYTHPQVMEELISPTLGAIWHKIGRRGAGKASQLATHLTAAVPPGLPLPGLDTFLPADRIDYQCQPNELGWLLYAWSGDELERPVTSPVTGAQTTDLAARLPMSQVFDGHRHARNGAVRVLPRQN